MFSLNCTIFLEIDFGRFQSSINQQLNLSNCMNSLFSNQKSETEKDAENNLSTFLIIDQDELSKNDTQVIQKIIDDYERRLQEQIALAKQDFVNELDSQFQVSCVCGFLILLCMPFSVSCFE